MIHKTACKYCGVILTYDSFDNEHEYRCPRCNSLFYKPGQAFIYPVSMAISSLLFFIAANFLDFLSISVAGVNQSVTVLEAIINLAESHNGSLFDGRYIVTFVALFVGIIIPIVLLLILLWILIPFMRGRVPKHFVQLYGKYNHLRHWAMADVYMLAVIVALIKLFGVGDVTIGAGFFMFLLFLVSFYSAYTWFNPYDLWLKYEMENRSSGA